MLVWEDVAFIIVDLTFHGHWMPLASFSSSTPATMQWWFVCFGSHRSLANRTTVEVVVARSQSCSLFGLVRPDLYSTTMGERQPSMVPMILQKDCGVQKREPAKLQVVTSLPKRNHFFLVFRRWLPLALIWPLLASGIIFDLYLGSSFVLPIARTPLKYWMKL